MCLLCAFPFPLTPLPGISVETDEVGRVTAVLSLQQCLTHSKLPRLIRYGFSQANIHDV